MTATVEPAPDATTYPVGDLVSTTPDPGPGTRIARAGSHAGGALVLVDLWHAFGWFGASGWSAEQAATRWPALTATAMFVIATAHNTVNWWTSRR